MFLPLLLARVFIGFFVYLAAAQVMGNLKWVKMAHGDVVLLDNYMTMHGRNIFDGVRKHAVTWFK